jgi:hypothetical protein
VSEKVQIKYEETDSPQASSDSPDNTHQASAEGASESSETHQDDEGKWTTVGPRKLSKRDKMEAEDAQLVLKADRWYNSEYSVL